MISNILLEPDVKAWLNDKHTSSSINISGISPMTEVSSLVAILCLHHVAHREKK